MLTSHDFADDRPVPLPPCDSWYWKKGKRVSSVENPYPLRKGTREVRRLNLQHSLHRDALGANFFAPLAHPQAILDVAGGTGIWGREMARQFPRAQVETFDKDILPFEWAVRRLKSGTIPPNFAYRTGNALGRFPYEDARFDYVHARYISPFISQERWPGVLSEMVRVTRPGGWIELVDGPAAVSGAPGYREIEQAIQALARDRFGFYDPGLHLAGWLTAAGAEHVSQDVHVIGAGKTAWLQPRLAEMIEMACRAIEGHLVAGGYIPAERFQACMYDLRAEIEQAGITVAVHIVYGQKA